MILTHFITIQIPSFMLNCNYISNIYVRIEAFLGIQIENYFDGLFSNEFNEIFAVGLSPKLNTSTIEPILKTRGEL